MSTTFTFFESIVSFLAAKGIIPIFGSTDPGLHESLFSYLMNLALPLSFALLIGMIMYRTYRGSATKRLVNSFLAGYVFTLIIFSATWFMVLNLVYYKFLTVPHIESWAASMAHSLNRDFTWAYNFLMNVRGVLIPSAIFSLMASMGGAAIITFMWIGGTVRSNRFKAFVQEWE